MVEKWKKIKSKQVFGNKIFGFREDLVVSPKTNKEHPVWAMDVPDWIGCYWWWFHCKECNLLSNGMYERGSCSRLCCTERINK